MCCFRLITFMKGLTKFLSEPCDIIMFHFIIINTSPLSSIQTLGTIPFREKNNFMKSDQGHIPGYPPPTPSNSLVGYLLFVQRLFTKSPPNDPNRVIY